MKRAFKYRFHPTHAQAAELSRTFGCVRKVYNPPRAPGPCRSGQGPAQPCPQGQG
ncbi:helix-turn-helix domain-containing protein [Streptomyces sp. NPDC090798]|uniref:helix-turn-helix domain-containing protein n=1 Tax=Streptomyces sp. NPDC090798 TaxID=3365968 RepID=UPI0038115E77